MKMYFDKFSEIGSAHKENEDFSVIGDQDNPFIIVSDGCSSSGNTSTGSRILSFAVADTIMKASTLKLVDIGRISIQYASGIAKLLSLDERCLDSTLMVAFVEEHHVRVCIWGDGFVFYKYKNELPEFQKIEYSQEAPFYLSYQLDDDRMKFYQELVNNGSIIKTESFETGTATVPVMEPTEFGIYRENLEYVMLSTDGIGTFILNNTPVDQVKINERVTSFKRLNGEFIGRRINRMMKENEKGGIKHYDDFTIAGISFIE